MTTSNKGLVTIAIPAYKATFLREAIESALKQDYKNIELIIVDDCSPHKLDKIAQQYSNDPRVRYYRNKENLGKVSIVHNWNKCLEYARGEYFVLLCDDDLLLPNFVTSLLELADKYPACNVFHARKTDTYADGSKRDSPVWPEYEDADTFLRNRLAKKRHHTITEFLYRTAAIKEKKYTVFPKGFYSDNASIIDFSRNGGVVSCEKCLALFRHSDEHISGSNSPENCIGKTHDAIEYWQWIHKFDAAKDYEQQISEEVQCTIYNSFAAAPFFTKLKILAITPYNILPLKLRMGFILKSII